MGVIGYKEKYDDSFGSNILNEIMKLVWLSDLHFEFLTESGVEFFISTLGTPDAVLITGDISNARSLEGHLIMLATNLSCPIYFVLGNHDFYLSSFEAVNAKVSELCRKYPNLIELDSNQIVHLSSETALIGHRGWADGRAGTAQCSPIRLNDHEHIADLQRGDPQSLFSTLNRLGDASARYIRRIGPLALKGAKNLIIATHVPPFEQAALYQNKPSNPDYAPHFVNKALGQSILELARRHQAHNLTVLCGHTHHRAFYQPAANVTVKVAGADYYTPVIAEVLLIQ